MDSAFDELFNEEQEYPFAYFVVCLGFLMILVIEQVVLSCIENQQKAKAGDPSCNCENTIRSGLPGIYLLYVLMLIRNYCVMQKIVKYCKFSLL